MNKGDVVKLTRDLPLLPTGGILAAGSKGIVYETGKNHQGEALALVYFHVIDATIVVDCARLRTAR